MAAISTTIYSLNDVNTLVSNGFNYELPMETLTIISELSQQVGSPDYIRTPIFVKREHTTPYPHASASTTESSYTAGAFSSSSSSAGTKKARSNPKDTATNWESIRSSNSASASGSAAASSSGSRRGASSSIGRSDSAEKSQMDITINALRTHLNKLSDKNYIDIRNKVVDTLDALFCDGDGNGDGRQDSSADLTRISTLLFDIASNNRFFSKMYAELYAYLLKKYPRMRPIFDENLHKFTALFATIEYVEPSENYDRFCELNKINETRKSLAAFYVNLMHHGIISYHQILHITHILLEQIYTFIRMEGKKNEVDELAENIAILFQEEYYDRSSTSTDHTFIDGKPDREIVYEIARSKPKDFKSLTNKTIFKFMDIIDH